MAEHPEGLPESVTVEMIVMRQVGDTVVVVEAPPLSAVSPEMLAKLVEQGAVVDDVLTLPGGYRYLVGAALDDELEHLGRFLYRLP